MWAWFPVVRSSQRRTARRNVSSDCGSGGSPAHRNASNSCARPRRTASISAGSEWLVKYGNGAASAYSSPMKRSGTNGASSTAPAASLAASNPAVAASRSPSIRFPTWSCVWLKTTKWRPCMPRAGAPWRRPRYADRAPS